MVLRWRATFWMSGWLACGILGLGAPVATSIPELERQLHDELSKSASPGALWGIQIISQRTGENWFSTNVAARLIPASNAKLYTAALALDRLGSDYRFVTSLRTSTRSNADGVLKGDLMVIGGGDPTRCRRLNGGTLEATFAPLVQAVQAAGIRRITGGLICDESRFRGPPYGSGWAWDDLAQSYGASASALSAEDNIVQVVAQPASRAGDPATVRFEPISPGMTLMSRVTTSATNSAATLNVTRLPGTDVLDVWGSLPEGGAPKTETASVPEPAMWFGALFREALDRAGIEVAGDLQRVTAFDRSRTPLDDSVWREIAAVPSLPAGDVILEMMKRSQNLYAHLVLLSVGAEAEMYPRDDETRLLPAATTEASGLRALSRFLQQVGVEEGDVVLEEGSGLSRKNLITPRATVRLLEHMTRHRWMTAWMESLPVGGVDGTLAKRFTQPPTKGNVRAKTGTLQNISSLSGYVTNAAQEPVIFCILVNGYVSNLAGATAGTEIDRLVELVAQSKVR